MDTTITRTSGRGLSFPKCNTTLMPFLSYKLSGWTVPKSINILMSTYHVCKTLKWRNNKKQKAFYYSSRMITNRKLTRFYSFQWYKNISERLDFYSFRRFFWRCCGSIFECLSACCCQVFQWHAWSCLGIAWHQRLFRHLVHGYFGRRLLYRKTEIEKVWNMTTLRHWYLMSIFNVTVNLF